MFEYAESGEIEKIELILKDGIACDIRECVFGRSLVYITAKSNNVLQMLCNAPPGIKCDIKSLFAMARKRLFTAILNEKDTLIVSRATNVLTDIMSHEAIVPKIDAESLSCW